MIFFSSHFRSKNQIAKTNIDQLPLTKTFFNHNEQNENKASAMKYIATTNGTIQIDKRLHSTLIGQYHSYVAGEILIKHTSLHGNAVHNKP